MALCLAGMTAACGLAGGGEPGGEKETDKGQEEAVIHVLVTTHAWTKDIEDIPSFQELSEKTGVKVVWEQVRSGWEEKKNAILSSGDVPDVFLGGAITDADISAYPELFLPLNDYVEEQAPNVMRMFEEKPDTRMLAVFTDGNIYGLPSVKFHRPDSTSMMMINQDWLDALGLETPRTLEEFRDVLRAFRDGDPNGNGKADEIPFDFSNNRGLFTAMNLIGAYGKCAEDFSGEWFGMAQGEILFLPVTEEYYQLTGYLHSLFEEGLINPEVFNQDYSQFQQKSKNPAAMTVGATLGWSIEDRVGPDYADSYQVLLPLRASEETEPFWPSHPARAVEKLRPAFPQNGDFQMPAAFKDFIQILHPFHFHTVIVHHGRPFSCSCILYRRHTEHIGSMDIRQCCTSPNPHIKRKLLSLINFPERRHPLFLDFPVFKGHQQRFIFLIQPFRTVAEECFRFLFPIIRFRLSPLVHLFQKRGDLLPLRFPVRPLADDTAIQRKQPHRTILRIFHDLFFFRKNASQTLREKIVLQLFFPG